MSMLSRIGCFRQCYQKTYGHWQFYQELIDAVNVIKKLAVITHNKNNKLFLVAPSPWVLSWRPYRDQNCSICRTLLQQPPYRGRSI